MGEAKRRKALTEEYTAPDRRAEIAAVVRSVNLTTGAGTCAFRALCGQKVLSWLGIRSRLVWGAMIYRAGPDEIIDVVAYCGPGNAATWSAQVGALAHAWIEVGEDLVDFSTGDWRRESELTSGNPFDRLPNGEPAPPISWMVPPPDFWWRPRAPLTAPWRPRGTPEPGSAWYKEARAPADVADSSLGEMLRFVEPALRQHTARLMSAAPPLA